MKYTFLLLTLVSICSTFAKEIPIPYRVADKWGFITSMGEVVVEPRYQQTWLFSDQSHPYARCMAKFQMNGKIGYYNSDLKIAVEPKFIDGTDFNRGYAQVMDEDSTFVIDVMGNWAPSGKYQEPAAEIDWKQVSTPHALKPLEDWPNWISRSDFDNVFLVDTIIPNSSIRYYVVEKQEKYGLYIHNKLELAPIYDSIKAFDKKTFLTYEAGKIGVLNFSSSSKRAFKAPEFEEVRVMRKTGNYGTKHYVLYRKENRWGVIRSDKFTPAIYKNIDICRKRSMLLWVTTEENKTGLISDDFQWIYFSEKPPLSVQEIQLEFQDAEAFGDSLFYAFKNRKWRSIISEFEAVIIDVNQVENKPINEYYIDFILNQNMNEVRYSEGLNRLKKLFIKYNMYESGKKNVPGIMIEACSTLKNKFANLIEQYPNYPFSEYVVAFSKNQVNEISTGIILSGLQKSIGETPYETPFYKKMVIMTFAYMKVSRCF